MRFPEQRLSINTAVYLINWTGIQQLVRLPTCGFAYIGNAGAARTKGAELELSSNPVEGLSLTLGVGYTDAAITATSPNVLGYIGEPVQQVAPWTVSAAAEYERPLTARLRAIVRADEAYVDHSFSASNDQLHPRLRPSYDILNLRTGLASGPWEAFLFVNNATNERPNLSDNQSQVVELPGRPRILTSLPRTFGVDFRVRF
jgi:outer membrane receptor protein involved in Fe transport